MQLLLQILLFYYQLKQCIVPNLNLYLYYYFSGCEYWFTRNHKTQSRAFTNCKNDRCNTKHQFNLIFKKSEEIAIKIGLELQLPQSAIRQTQWDNYPSSNINNFYTQYLFIPYWNFINKYISNRFSDMNYCKIIFIVYFTFKKL